MFKDKISIILVVFLLLGISLLVYPSIADIWNARTSTRIISDYSDRLKNLTDQEIEAKLEDARLYNERIKDRGYKPELSQEESEEYNSLLRLGYTDLMASVEIPSINIKLPIYHGTKESVLQGAIGHIDWTSLPVGGESSHATITGHRGLISARLFTDIDQLIAGDLFYINVLNKKLTYQVDQIKIVEPHEIKDLLIEEGKDMVTLLTCTPYGINTHRLLVRGERVEDKELRLNLNSEAVRIKPIIVASVIMIPVSIVFALGLIAFDRGRERRKHEK